MRFAALIPLLGSVWNLMLAVFVLSRNRRARINQVYFGLGLAIATWNAGQYFLFTLEDPAAAMIALRFEWLAVIVGPTLLCHLSMLICGVGGRRMAFGLYALAAPFVALVWTPLFITGARHIGPGGWYAVPGPALFVFHPIFTCLVVAAMVILLRSSKRLAPLQRARTRTLAVAQGLLLASGLNDVLPIFRIDTYPMVGGPVYPYGSVFAAFYGILVAYSVLQHDLLDIQVSLSRWAAQAVRMAFLVFTCAILLLASEILWPGHFDEVSLAVSLGALALTAAAASFVFPRLFGAGGERLERRLLGDRFEYHDRVRSFIAATPEYADSELLLGDLRDLLLNTFGASSYQIILVDERRRAFNLFRSHPALDAAEIPELTVESPVFQHFRRTGLPYLLMGGDRSPGQHGDDAEAAREQLAVFGAQLCFPFLFEGEPFGLMLLGAKRSGDPFTATDVALLSELVKTVSQVINQLRLKTQVLQQQEFDLLGRMSRGMAHDLNNLLTPIHTYLQLLSEGAPVDALNEELLPVALRNIATLQSYIREALFFSENLRPDFQLGRLDVVVTRVAQIVADRARRRSVALETFTPAEMLAEMDTVLVERLLTNLVTNAIDASPPGGRVTLELHRLPRTDLHRDWMRVSVIDAGHGIAPENLSRVTTAYFTTKRTGDESRGFGLGLAISRRIVQLHGGFMSISSEVGRGTRVDVDLPSKQARPDPPVARSAT